ncbi:MAG: type II toxin-antitoxin system VapC family toxin [Gammaproteobacteria bacterium]
MVYADTSVVLSFYRAEPESRRAQKFLGSLKEPACISLLTETEFASALARWVRMRAISDADANRIHAAFQTDIDEGCYHVIPLTTAHYRQATAWLLSRKSPLRVLDALHLACAAKREIPLATFDRTLMSAAAQFGVSLRHL